MAARSSDLPGITTARMLEHVMDGYALAFEEDDATPKTPRIVRQIMREATGRSWKHLARERIEDVAPAIPLGKRFWPLRDDDCAAVDGLFAEEATRRLVASLRPRDDDAAVRVLDAAYWRKGCSSLGRLRLAVLVAVDSGKPERHCLIDVKEAVAPAAARSGRGTRAVTLSWRPHAGVPPARQVRVPARAAAAGPQARD